MCTHEQEKRVNGEKTCVNTSCSFHMCEIIEEDQLLYPTKVKHAFTTFATS